MWECGEGQADRHTDDHDQYTFRLGYASHEMLSVEADSVAIVMSQEYSTVFNLPVTSKQKQLPTNFENSNKDM